MSDANLPSPARVKASQDTAESKKARLAREFEAGRAQGLREGKAEGRKELLDFLERAYLDDSNRPERGSDKGTAILEVARDAALHFRTLNERDDKRARSRKVGR